MNGFHHEEKEENILQKVLDLVNREKLLCEQDDRSDHKVIEFVHPKELEKCLGGLLIGNDPSSSEEVDRLMELVVKYSVRTCHHRFYNQVGRYQIPPLSHTLKIPWGKIWD